VAAQHAVVVGERCSVQHYIDKPGGESGIAHRAIGSFKVGSAKVGSAKVSFTFGVCRQ
jgi:hypothetical protein